MTNHWPVYSALLLAGWLMTSCGNEYVCPDPIGAIIRDDCDVYRTRYESLKVDLSFSIGHLGVSAAAGKEKLRDPSELLQLLLQQTMALCKDFNACRVPSTDYRRRREDADRKFTAITAITQQLKTDLDKESKRKLVAKLIEVITDDKPAPRRRRGRSGRRSSYRRQPVKACTHWLVSSTSMFFGSKFQPRRPPLPDGVPALASYEMTHSRGAGWGGTSTYLHVRLWGKAEADDYIYVQLPGGISGKAKVKPQRKRPEARASFKFKKRILERGQMVLTYRRGATLKKHAIGSFRLDPEHWIRQGFISYMPDPPRMACPLDYERPYLVFYSQLPSRTRVTVRCKRDGKSIPGVLSGRAASGTYRASKLRRYHIPLPVRIPLKGGTERGKWRASPPGEQKAAVLFPGEAAGLWQCRVSFNGRTGRRISFRLKSDGSVQGSGKLGPFAGPWWPIKVERVANDLERQRRKELAVQEAKDRAREVEAARRRNR